MPFLQHCRKLLLVLSYAPFWVTFVTSFGRTSTCSSLVTSVTFRWKEETALLQEEMRRVIVFFEWKAHWWRIQGRQRSALPQQASGLIAYAEKQAWILEKRAQRFAAKWLPLLEQHAMTPEWAVRYKGKGAEESLEVNIEQDD